MGDLTDPDPPPSRVADVLEVDVSEGTYVEGGRAMPSSHGWAWIAEGFRCFRRQASIWILLTVIFLALGFGLHLVPIFGQLAFVLVMPVLVGGLMSGCRTVERGGEVELAHLFAGFRRRAGQLALVGAIGLALTLGAMLPLLLTTGMSLGAAGAGNSAAAFAFGASAMLGVLISLALLIPVNMAMWFAPALVMLQNQSAPRAIGQSFRGCLKNIVPFLIYGVIIFVCAFVAAIPFGLGWLVLAPIVLCSVYAAYRDVFFRR